MDLEEKLVCEINESEEEKAMPIITNAEKIGMEKGKIEGKIETAIKMLDDGLSTAAIAKYTGLSEAKIKSLAKKPTKKAA